MDSVKTVGLPCPFCGAGLVRSEEFSNRSRDIFVHEIPAAGETDCPARGIILDKSDLAKWNRRAASPPAGAEVVAREPYNPTTQPFDEPFRHVERDIVHRLTERAALARAEDNATARADARHFEEAATLITSLRDALSDAAYIACLQKDDHSERGWFIVGWQGGRHSIPNNEEQAWLYRRGMVARMAADPRPETEADRWCRNFTEKPDVA